MRLLNRSVRPRLPMEDCEWGSQMIRMFERPPRPNRHLPAAVIRIGDLFGGLVLAGVAVVLGVLLCTL